MKKSDRPLEFFLSQENLSCSMNDLHKLETVLRPYIQKHVYKLRLNHWYGAEKEIAEDVLAETFLRIIPYVQRATSDTSSPIRSLEALGKTIAQRYLLDLRRKDKHLAFSIDNVTYFNEYQYIDMWSDPAESVVEDMLVYAKMQRIARAVKDFSPKLKEAMLVHFANIADFDDEHPYPLERAMWSVGISLREYRRERYNSTLRSRQASLVCLGYKLLRGMVHAPFTQPPDCVA